MMMQMDRRELLVQLAYPYLLVGAIYTGSFFAVTNIPNLLSTENAASGYAIAEIFHQAFNIRYGSGVGGIIYLGIVVVVIFFYGMSSITSNSRMAYAFSRDGAMPLSKFWHQVNKQEEDANEEFKPLFDYTRVQPRDIVCLDDDSEDAPVIFLKRRKISGAEATKKVVDVNVKDAKVVNLDKEEDKEEDWLPPPPKSLIDSDKALGEGSTLKALRLKRQELASFAQSAEELVQAVEGSVRKTLHASLQYSPQIATKQTLEPPPERAKLVISIQDKDGLKQFRVYMDDKLERLFKMYADRIKLNVNTLVFLFDGDKISSSATPDSLGMEENDIIEVHVKSS